MRKEKKKISLFDRDQLDLIGNLFSDILENPGPKWEFKPAGDSIEGKFWAAVEFKLTEDTPPMGQEVTIIKLSFITDSPFRPTEPEPDKAYYLSISIGDQKEYDCEDDILNDTDGFKRLKKALEGKIRELKQKALEKNKLEGKNLVSILQSAKKQQGS
ncbi:hypothetical protein JXB28_00290 [Candidatus Woesearchaeota archaeon]|nr:hypothetical protein [Candidatus Woesearchaeota archaeon]